MTRINDVRPRTRLEVACRTSAKTWEVFGLLCFVVMGGLWGCSKARTGTVCPPNSDCVVHDVTTKAKILEVMGRIEGKKLDAQDLCVTRFDEFPHLVRVGYFAHDAGCMNVGAFYRGVYWEKGTQISSAVLADSGWADSPKERARLANLWVLKVELAQESVLHETKSPRGLEDSDYHPPRVASASDGAVKIHVWVKLESGQSRDDLYALLNFEFSQAGVLTSRVQRRVTVPARE